MGAGSDLRSATGGFAVTPSDSADIAPTRFLWIAGAGDIKVTFVNGDVVTLTALAAKTLINLAVRRVWSTGTTATGIVALT